MRAAAATVTVVAVMVREEAATVDRVAAAKVAAAKVAVAILAVVVAAVAAAMVTTAVAVLLVCRAGTPRPG